LTTTFPSRRGPELPYNLVAGVKPCATGWLVAAAKLHGTTFAPEEPRVLETFIDVLDQRPAFATIALNAPIGYLDTFAPGGRTCDREARSLLGRRGAAIQSAPTRVQIEEESDQSIEGLSAVTRKLLPRYREVAAEMAPYRQRTVYEVSSELSFYQLNEDRPLRWSKRSEGGQRERRELLERKIPGGARIFDAQFPRVPKSHLLDVAAFMWTARRIFARAGNRIPQDPQWDEQGLRMEIIR
jgi:predicted RNase H-like nuclease